MKNIDSRLGAEIFASRAPGILADGIVHLESLPEDVRFEQVCNLIASASGDGENSSWIEREVAETLGDSLLDVRVARFSFEPAIHLCLWHARNVKASSWPASHMPDYPVRYAGTVEDVRLMAFAAHFLGLDVYADTAPLGTQCPA